MNLRNVVIFLAGMQFYHTIDHLFIAFFAPLPMDLKFMILTPTINYWSIVINAVITVFLLIWAAKLNKQA